MSYNHYLNKIANTLQEELITTGGIEIPTDECKNIQCVES